MPYGPKARFKKYKPSTTPVVVAPEDERETFREWDESDLWNQIGGPIAQRAWGRIKKNMETRQAVAGRLSEYVMGEVPGTMPAEIRHDIETLPKMMYTRQYGDYPMAAFGLAGMITASGYKGGLPKGATGVGQIKAFHGSPHKFDEFKMTKIGTGEGAQAFGHGLYFTDKKSIAKGYAQKLGKMKPTMALSGDEAVKVANILKGKGYFTTGIPSDTNAIKSGLQRIGNISDNDVSAAMKEAGIGNKVVYDVTLHKGKTPDQYDYLRWDKTASGDALRKVNKQARKEGIGDLYTGNLDKGTDITGEEVYRTLSGMLGEPAPGWGTLKFDDKAASDFLLRAGIDGIQYPTGTLSGVKGSKNFNYVVFDESAISID